MPLNQACVGREYPPVTINVTLDAIQKYARAYNDDNAAFFDASRAGGIIAPPMFGVTVTWDALMKAMMDPDLHVDLLAPGSRRAGHGISKSDSARRCRHRDCKSCLDRDQDHRRDDDR